MSYSIVAVYVLIVLIFKIINYRISLYFFNVIKDYNLKLTSLTW